MSDPARRRWAPGKGGPRALSVPEHVPAVLLALLVSAETGRACGRLQNTSGRAHAFAACGRPYGQSVMHQRAPWAIAGCISFAALVRLLQGVLAKYFQGINQVAYTNQVAHTRASMGHLAWRAKEQGKSRAHQATTRALLVRTGNTRTSATLGSVAGGGHSMMRCRAPSKSLAWRRRASKSKQQDE